MAKVTTGNQQPRKKTKETEQGPAVEYIPVPGPEGPPGRQGDPGPQGSDGGLQVDPATLLSDAAGQSLTVDGEGKIYGSIPDVGPVGKVLQVVRAYMNQNQSTSSTSYVDVPGFTVDITPQEIDSHILLVMSCAVRNPSTGYIYYKMLTSDGSAVGGSNGCTGSLTADNEPIRTGLAIGWYKVITTSPITFKVQHRVTKDTGAMLGAQVQLGQLFAMEVSA